MSAKREYGIDLARIISMMGIVCVHMLTAGEGRNPMYLLSATGFSLNTLSFLVQPAVNVFAMITGYLYVSKPRIKSGNLIGLMLNLEAYSLLFTLALYFLSNSFLNDLGSVLGSLFPMATGAYWYLTAYIGTFLLIPWLNKLIHSMNQKQHCGLLWILFILFSVVPTLTLVDFFGVKEGYSTLWLVFCYLLGGYVRIYRDRLTEDVKRWGCLVAILGCTVAAMGYYLLVCFGICPDNFFYALQMFISPLCIAIAVLTLLFFMETEVKHTRCQKGIKLLSDAAFEVYVIHCHPYFYDIFIRGKFDFLVSLSPVAAIGLVAGIIVGFYLFSTLACVCRKWVFRVLGIDRLTSLLGAKADSLQDKIWNPAP